MTHNRCIHSGFDSIIINVCEKRKRNLIKLRRNPSLQLDTKTNLIITFRMSSVNLFYLLNDENVFDDIKLWQFISTWFPVVFSAFDMKNAKLDVNFYNKLVKMLKDSRKNSQNQMKIDVGFSGAVYQTQRRIVWQLNKSNFWCSFRFLSIQW